MKKALITGITGQDGSYLAELLLAKGYEVHGLVRRSSSFNTWRIDQVRDQLHLHYGDLIDTSSLIKTLQLVGPDEIYNLAAQSHVKVSFDMPEYTGNSTGLGFLRLLDAVREVGLAKSRVLPGRQLREMFGKVVETPQKETTPFYPRSALRRGQGVRRTGSRSTTARATTCTCRTASCSITSRPGAARTS
jgi:GDPmannose 4,6-dehydratase